MKAKYFPTKGSKPMYVNVETVKGETVIVFHPQLKPLKFKDMPQGAKLEIIHEP